MDRTEHSSHPDRDNGLQHYLDTIGRYDLLTPAQERDLASRVRQGDQCALDQLVNANLRFVVSVAKRYVNRGLSLRDLIAEGNVGLITAAKRFDERREFRFVTYAAWWIRQSIQVALSEQTTTVRLPANRVREVRRANELEIKLEQQLQRQVTEDEVAEALALDPRKLAQIRRASRPLVSINESSYEDGETLAETIADTTAVDPEQQFAASELRRELHAALDHLDERERHVLARYFGLDEAAQMSLEAIGRGIDLSRERVRQLRNRAIERIKATSAKATLAEFLN